MRSTESVKGKRTVGGTEAVGSGVLDPPPKMPSKNPELPWALDAPSLECCDCEPELPVRASMRPLLAALGRYWGLNSCASGASCAATRSRPPMDRKAAKTATVLGSMMGH